MNQILTTKPVKPKKTVNIKTIKMVFGICIIIFGICLLTSGSYAVYKHRSSIPKTPVQNNTEDIESQEPTVSGDIQILLSIEGTNIKATVTSLNELSFVTYKWDNEEETRQDINGSVGEFNIETPEGSHTLTVTAVDIYNNTKTVDQQVVGAIEGNGKPMLEVTRDEGNFIVKTSDEVGLDRVEFILNGEGYLVRLEGVKEREFKYPIVEGDNTLEVTVYNVNGTTATFKALIRN